MMGFFIDSINEVNFVEQDRNLFFDIDCLFDPLETLIGVNHKQFLFKTYTWCNDH